MSAKRILFIVLCVLLVVMFVMTGIVLSEVSGMLSLLNPQPSPAPEVTTPSEIPTEPESTEHIHDYALSDTIQATCTGYGWKVYTCQTCDHVHMPVEERIDPLGHSYDSGKVTEADCTNGGYTEFTCTRCNITDIPADKQIAPLGHSWGHGQVCVATCEEGGFTAFTCTRCDVVEKRDQTDPLGHQFETLNTFPATCTEDAYTRSLCTREGCGVEELVTEVGTATGHIPGDWHALETGEFTQVCNTCSQPVAQKVDSSKPYDIVLNLQQVHEDPSGEGVGYISHSVTIGVSGDVSVKMFTYTVNDYLCNNTLALTYQSELGLILEYTDQDGTNQRYSVNHAAPLTITINATGAPTIE